MTDDEMTELTAMPLDVELEHLQAMIDIFERMDPSAWNRTLVYLHSRYFKEGTL